MPKLGLLVALFTLSSCGGFSLFADKNIKQKREIASLTVERLVAEENHNFSDEIEEKVRSLYKYYAIAYKNLYQFEESLGEQTLEEAYSSLPYLSLLAVKTQVDEIEKELLEVHKSLSLGKNSSDTKKKEIIEEKIIAQAKASTLGALAMANLSEFVELEVVKNEKLMPKKKFNELYKELENEKDFRIYEKNIEHLSHLMETNIRSTAKKFKPSHKADGNVTGKEFPAKVWALTFSNGPGKKVTSKILNKLNEKNMKATFFQVTENTLENKAQAEALIASGMEIGSNSYGHKELTKVGHLTLEKEIVKAKEMMEKSLNIDVEFFRLPYGAGMDVPSIRNMIASNNMIHVYWNIDTLDWLAQSPDSIVKRTKSLMSKTSRDAGIIMFHDIHHRSVVASAEIMNHLKHDGRRACTLGTIVRDMNKGEGIVCSSNSF